MAGSEHIPGVQPYRILRRGNFTATVYTSHPEGQPDPWYWVETAHGQQLGEVKTCPASAILIARRYLRAVTDAPTNP
ncbi:hypothetical protein ACIRRA_44585 [Nocardia sp. NPDC101769]|uniref:hypothetical protein n=1 Tax=Nocardia sp. NPDC101769 TaxID=3364333 RepID=UPI0037FE5448